jgi:hypothetical protein
VLVRAEGEVSRKHLVSILLSERARCRNQRAWLRSSPEVPRPLAATTSQGFTWPSSRWRVALSSRGPTDRTFHQIIWHSDYSERACRIRWWPSLLVSSRPRAQAEEGAIPLLVLCPLAIGLACNQSLKRTGGKTTRSYTCTFASGLSPSVIQIETYFPRQTAHWRLEDGAPRGRLVDILYRL